MKINGLIESATLALMLAAPSMVAADERIQLVDFLEHEPLVLDATAGEPAASEDDCCYCACGRVPHWFAGVEMTFLGVEAGTGGNITFSMNDSDTPGTDLRLIAGDGFETFTTAPRLTLGRKFGEKWGVALRYWELNDHEEGRALPPPGVVNLAHFLTHEEEQRVEMRTLDLEAIRTFRPGVWTIDGTLGVRHAQLSSAAELNAFGVFTPGNFLNMALFNSVDFYGTGVTGGMTFRRPIADSYAHFFLSARGSGLSGRTDSRAGVAGTLANSPSPPLVGAATVTRNNALATATIAEIQVGVEWDFPIFDLPFNAFFRTAFEYQHWIVDGLPTGGAGFGGTIDDSTVNSFSRVSADYEAQLYGLTLGAGLTW